MRKFMETNDREYNYSYECVLPTYGITALLKPNSNSFELILNDIYGTFHNENYSTAKEAMDYVNKKYFRNKHNWILRIDGEPLRKRKSLFENLKRLVLKRKLVIFKVA